MSEEYNQRLKEYQRNYRRSRQAAQFFHLYFFFSMYKMGKEDIKKT